MSLTVISNFFFYSQPSYSIKKNAIESSTWKGWSHDKK